MIVKIFIPLSIIIAISISSVSPVSIYKDPGVFEKSQRGWGRQINPQFYDDYPAGSSRYMESRYSRWDNADWPQDLARGDDTYESNEHPYSWFYYNKYLTNGRYNHLYNGPQVDDNAGLGDPADGDKPKLLPHPQSSFGRYSEPRKWTRGK